MTPEDLRQHPDFAALKRAAARLGRDPLQIQGPGGNVSLKAGGTMLVKASGTWLADAEEAEVFTAVDAGAMKRALVAGDPAADVPAEFALGAGGLRPSIETSFHACLDAPVVLHTHCVATLAASVTGAGALPRGSVRVRYEKPGADLARAVLAAWGPGTRAAVLVNHGVIVAGETVAEAEATLAEIAAHFETGAAPRAAPDPGLAEDLAGTGWEPLPEGATTALAFDPARLAIAGGLALCPDQVIFLGPSPRVGPPVAALAADDGPPRHLALLPGRGAAVPAGSSPALRALAEMMGEVVFRIDPGAPVARLTLDQCLDLLGWEAEKHRQALEAARTARLAGDRA